MKISENKLKSSKAKAAPDKVEVIDPPAVVKKPVAITLPKIHGKSPAERAIAWHVAGQKFGRMGAACIIAAGWELAQVQANCAWGEWGAWCKKNLTFDKKTAENYIELYSRTVGVLRGETGTALNAPLTKDEICAATIGMEHKTLTQAYVDLGIIKREKWGGKREDAGRKKKVEAEDVKAALDAVAQNEALLWAAAKSALDTLVQLDADRDFLRRLSDDHLATVVSILGELSDKAAQVFQTRLSTPAAGMLPNREGETGTAAEE